MRENVTAEEMNLLQGAGIISDNCVWWEDVADCDKEKASAWLDQRNENALSKNLA